tara:strand:+ start:1479 stop:1658 length:180 start_codon:yes stop_codon:yes gene_type:complete
MPALHTRTPNTAQSSSFLIPFAFVETHVLGVGPMIEESSHHPRIRIWKLRQSNSPLSDK